MRKRSPDSVNPLPSSPFQPRSSQLRLVSSSSRLPTPGGDLKQNLQAALVKAGLNFTADAVAQAEVTLRNSELLIRAPKTLLLSLKEPKLQSIASEVAGRKVQVRAEASASSAVAPGPALAAPVETTDLRERALSHPGVKRFQELFPDAQVRTVRNLNE